MARTVAQVSNGLAVGPIEIKGVGAVVVGLGSQPPSVPQRGSAILEGVDIHERRILLKNSVFWIHPNPAEWPIIR